MLYPQKICLSLTLLAASFIAVAQDKEIFKYTDENGVTHYSDKKLNDNYQSADKLPELMVVPPMETQPIQRSKRSSNKKNGKVEGDYSGFSVISPSSEENLWGTGGAVVASVDFNGELLPTHRIQFSVDGDKKKADKAKTQTFDGLIRGQHSLKAAIITADDGEVIRETQAVTFFIHQNSKK